MTKLATVIATLLIFLSTNLLAQTQKDTIYTYYTKTPVVIDGSDSDACWAKAQWHAMDQVWIPYNQVMADGDFEGRYKVAWDKNYLYILVEVNDNILSDDHTNPTDNYWNDDCVEIFIDEDRSKGNHLNSYNAFAYHVSIKYDAIDGGTGSAVNLKNNLTVVIDTIDETTYVWEFAMKIYNSTFKPSSPENSRVYLTANKLMGFSIAYCDNDETKARENFIGSMIMPEANANDNYITADYFGSMLLVDPDNESTSSLRIRENEKMIKFYPNPAKEIIEYTVQNQSEEQLKLGIYSITGELVQSLNLNEKQGMIEIGNLNRGVYYFSLTSGSSTNTEVIIKL